MDMLTSSVARDAEPPCTCRAATRRFLLDRWIGLQRRLREGASLSWTTEAAGIVGSQVKALLQSAGAHCIG